MKSVVYDFSANHHLKSPSHRQSVSHNYNNNNSNLGICILQMLPTKWRRKIFWSSKSTKRIILVAGICMLISFLCLFNNVWYQKNPMNQIPGDNRRLLLENGNKEVAHVFVPHPIVRNTLISQEVTTTSTEHDDKIAILVMSATRSAAVKNHLTQLLKYRPNASKFPIIISQDGENGEVTSTIKEFINETAQIYFIHHKDRTGLDSPTRKSAKNYFFIAQHYKYALDKVFLEYGYKTVIITEDDLDLSPDFFSYFESTKHLLYEDESIWCISAWNDNGASDLVDQGKSETLYRTDFFPGLGWMLTSKLWEELSQIWPLAYWDDWLRTQDVRKNRCCIRPEVSRTVHNNKLAGRGSSNGLYKKFLASIGLPANPVDFSLVDVNRLKKNNYDPFFQKQVQEAKPLTIEELINQRSTLDNSNSYRVIYINPREYRQIAKAFNLMNDIRSGMARTAYYGIIPFMVNKARVYAVHGNIDISKSLESYESSSLYHVDWDKMSRFLDFADMYCKPGKWQGKCDPNDAEMIEWFKKRNQMKRLKAWGDMIVI